MSNPKSLITIDNKLYGSRTPTNALLYNLTSPDIKVRKLRSKETFHKVNQSVVLFLIEVFKLALGVSVNIIV